MDLGECYLEVALRFGRLVPSLVEDYVGPAALAARVDAGPRGDYAGVARAALELRGLAARMESDPVRVAWLEGQLAAIEVACRRLAGAPIGYRELVERCHGVQAREVEESQFAQAHDLLGAALPGRGSVRERYAAWESAQLVAGERLLDGLAALARELRDRCHALWPLPDDEKVTFERVGGERWLASAGYQGGLWTHVRVNERVPIPAWRLVEIVAHEAYPGHHTEAVSKQASLVSARGRSELGVYVYPTPQATMAEGIAMLAPEILLGDQIDDVATACLRPLGIDYDTTVACAARTAAELLLPLRANLALMRDEDRINPAGMRAYARRWLLADDASVDHTVSSLCAREWPPVESSYPEGLRLCRQFVRGDPQAFGQLLREQLTPAALAA